MKKIFSPSLIACALLAMLHRVFAKPASAKPVINATSYDAINAYVEEQMSHLSIPGGSLARAITRSWQITRGEIVTTPKDLYRVSISGFPM